MRLDATKLRRFLTVAVLVSLPACAPLTAPPPFHFLETADVLAKGDKSLTVAAGAGDTGLDGPAVGGGLRLRAGVGAGQELRIEAAVLWHDTTAFDQDHPDPQQPWRGPSLYFGLKLSYKWAPFRWVAVSAGLGGSESSTGLAVGGDLALLVSAPRPLGGWIQPYLGLRGGVAVPIDHGTDTVGGVTRELVFAGGFCFTLRPRVRLLVEAGLLSAWNQAHSSPDVFARQGPDAGSYSHLGGYGALAVELQIPK